MKINAPSKQDQNKRGTNISANSASGNQKSYIVVPYVKGLSENLKNVCRKHGVQVYCKAGNTIKSLLMSPKDKISSQRRVASSIDTNVRGWSVMMNT